MDDRERAENLIATLGGLASDGAPATLLHDVVREAFAAVRAAALEDAARACDALVVAHGSRAKPMDGWRDDILCGVEEAAAAIRALREAP